MNWLNTMLNFAQEVANSPRTLAASAFATAGLGVADLMEILRTGLGVAGLVLGVIATGLLIRLHLINYKIAVIQSENLMRERDRLIKLEKL